MNADMAYVFSVLGVAVLMFASGRVRLDVVALLVLLALLLGNIITVREALAGFSDSVVIMIAGLFVVGEALVSTGIAFAVGQWLMRIGGGNELRLVALLMVTVGLTGAFISSTGIVAIFIPIALSIASKTGVPPARLMMPLSVAALTSGMMTLIATAPNLVASDALQNEGYAPFGFFDFTPIGLAVLAVAVIYMLFIGRRLIGVEEVDASQAPREDSIDDLLKGFGLDEKYRRLRVSPSSSLVDRTVAELELRDRLGIYLVSVERKTDRGVRVSPGLPRTKFASNDAILVIGQPAAIEQFVETQGLTELPVSARVKADVVREMGVASVMLAPHSPLIGKTVREARLGSDHMIDVLAIMRSGQPIDGDIRDEPIRFGDILLVSGRWQAIRNLRTAKADFVVLDLPREIADVAPARSQAPWALGILVLMVAAMTFELLPNVAAVMIAALALVATRCLSMNTAYQSIHWPSLVLIAGMLPLATALKHTGGTEFMVNGLVSGVGHHGPYAVMAGLFAFTAVLGLFISNTATAVLLAPIAIGVAADMGVSPAPYVMTVAIASSAAFMTPVSSPVNTLVAEPGGYSFMDFVKVGVPLVVLVGVVSLALVPILFPLH